MSNRELEVRISKNLHMKRNHIRTFIVSLCIFIITYFAALLLSNQLMTVYEKDYQIKIQTNYVHFQDKLNSLIEAGEHLLTGYSAFYIASEEVTPEESSTYLDLVTKKYSQYIRSITMLQGTTVAYSYPSDKNYDQIGTDWMEIREYETILSLTKREMTNQFYGPTNLPSGENVYMILVPIVDQNGDYWGQSIITLIPEEINESLLEVATANDLEILIYPDSESDIPLLGSETTLSKDPYRFEDLPNNWIIYATLSSPIPLLTTTRIVLIILTAMCALSISIAYAQNKYSRYRLKYAMTHDQLTDLYNRRYLDSIQKEIARTTTKTHSHYGLMHIDLDNFKLINDRYGHPYGDTVLQEISDILRSISRKSELIFRIGGDEFLILIPLTSSTVELSKMRNRYSEEFQKALAGKKYGKIIGISIGVSVYPKEGESFDNVLRAADIDMYEQKKIHKQTLSRES